ncbi:GNAT family N-acetyltransferase [Paenibacillus polymyxa]|nr:GNAT family N-acetyltransferase [Paenibacillus polymyxa]MDY8046152.1 GNAT family N-acetyltransferase [Paenibacillus polymyxa]
MILDVDDLFVDEEYRKRGISQLLLTAAQQHGTLTGFKGIGYR